MCNILIAESNTEVAKIMAEHLKKWSVIIIDSASEILQTVRSNNPEVVILSDELNKELSVSILTQFSLAGMINESMKVIITTDYYSKSEMEKAYAIGASSYLVKPVPSFLLHHVVNCAMTHISVWREKQFAEMQANIIFDMLPDPSILVEDDLGNIICLNNAMEDKFGIKSFVSKNETLVGLNVITKGERTRILKELKRNGGRLADLQVMFLLRSGPWNALMSANTIQFHNKSCLIITLRDVSSARRAVVNEDLGTQLDKLDQYLGRMQEIAACTEILAGKSISMVTGGNRGASTTNTRNK